MKRRRFLAASGLGLVGALVSGGLTGCGGGSSVSDRTQIEEAASFRIVPIPQREHGYDSFESQVIDSTTEMTRFLEKTAQDAYWNNKDGFFLALEQANLNFETESLVLIFDTEGSSGIRVTLDTPQLQGTTLNATVHISLFTGGTADMASHGFALAVRKDQVDAVAVTFDDPNDWSRKEPLHLAVGD
ncbi:MAG: hypothetical protein V4671_07105 [Armatimonadota bacterium]